MEITLGVMKAPHNSLKPAFILAALFVFLWALPETQRPAAAAETKPVGNLPGIDQILDKHIEAIGGKAALKKLTSRTIKGTAEMPGTGSTFTWDFYAKAPNKQASFIDIPGFGMVREGFDGKVAVSKSVGGIAGKER